MTYVVALTGGICSGKSTVAQYFQVLNIPIIDADIIAREIVAPGTKCFLEIVAHFDADILSNHQLNRKKLRQVIFSDKEERLWLEALLHPIIFQTIQDQIHDITTAYCIVAIPLLAESYNKYREIIDSVLVVDISEKKQIQRLTQRDQCDVSTAHKIIAAQASRSARLKIADQILSNETDFFALKQTVTKLHQQYLVLSQK